MKSAHRSKSKQSITPSCQPLLFSLSSFSLNLHPKTSWHSVSLPSSLLKWFLLSGSCLKAWELFRTVVACFPPSSSFAGPLSEYFLSEIHDDEAPTVIHQAVLSTWITLDKTLKVGPHKFAPTIEELETFMEGNTLPIVVYTYDESSKPLDYDMTTTVADIARVRPSFHVSCLSVLKISNRKRKETLLSMILSLELFFHSCPPLTLILCDSGYGFCH